jgi:hypothetical protein
MRPPRRSGAARRRASRSDAIPPACRVRRLGGGRAALWPPRSPRGARRCGLLGCRCRLAGGLLRGAAPAWRDASGTRAPCLDTHQRPGEAGPPWHRRALQTGAAPLQTRGALARCGDDDFVAHAQGDLRGPLPLGPQAHPQQRGPRSHGRAKAVHGPLTAPWASPPGQAHQRHTPRPDHHRQSQAVALAAALSSGRWGAGLANMLKCPSRASCGGGVGVVVDHTSRNLQKPLQVDRFWRR